MLGYERYPDASPTHARFLLLSPESMQDVPLGTAGTVALDISSQPAVAKEDKCSAPPPQLQLPGTDVHAVCGRWMKDKGLSDPVGPVLQVLGVSGLKKLLLQATLTTHTLQISQTARCMTWHTATSLIPGLGLREAHPTDGTAAVQRRRDLRGNMTSVLRLDTPGPRGGIMMELSWGGAKAGTQSDEVVLMPAGSAAADGGCGHAPLMNAEEGHEHSHEPAGAGAGGKGAGVLADIYPTPLRSRATSARAGWTRSSSDASSLMGGLDGSSPDGQGLLRLSSAGDGLLSASVSPASSLPSPSLPSPSLGRSFKAPGFKSLAGNSSPQKLCFMTGASGAVELHVYSTIKVGGREVTHRTVYKRA